MQEILRPRGEHEPAVDVARRLDRRLHPLHREARPVHARPLTVPEAEDAVELPVAAEPRSLRAQLFSTWSSRKPRKAACSSLPWAPRPSAARHSQKCKVSPYALACGDSAR